MQGIYIYIYIHIYMQGIYIYIYIHMYLFPGNKCRLYPCWLFGQAAINLCAHSPLLLGSLARSPWVAFGMQLGHVCPWMEATSRCKTTRQLLARSKMFSLRDHTERRIGTRWRQSCQTWVCFAWKYTRTVLTKKLPKKLAKMVCPNHSSATVWLQIQNYSISCPSHDSASTAKDHRICSSSRYLLRLRRHDELRRLPA